MTIQLATYASHGASKAKLTAALNETPARVRFDDPSLFQSRGVFFGNDIRVGERLTIVMDPPTRRRFAVVVRTDAGFRVE